MKYNKCFLEYENQINLLEERGIKFKEISKEEAVKKISYINYYKLSGYIKNFEISTDKYENVDFKEIIELYEFDRELSSHLFNLIERIEIAFKTNLAYFISKYTKEQGTFGYLKFRNWVDLSNKKFSDNSKILKEELKFKSSITNYCSRSSNEYIEKYFLKYDEENFVPLWMLVEVIDFGMGCIMYSNSHRSIRINIANKFTIPETDLGFYLKSLKLIRNIIAHNGILWNFKLINKINKEIVRKYEDIDKGKIIAVIIVIVEFLKDIDMEYDYGILSKHIIYFFEKYPKLAVKFGIKNNNIGVISEILKGE